MKRQTAKARNIAEQRRELDFALLSSRGSGCQACPISPVGTTPPRQWTEKHEILTRGRGGSPTDPDNILCLCSPCHAWVTTHEHGARALGLVRARTAEEHQQKYRPWESSP